MIPDQAVTLDPSHGSGQIGGTGDTKDLSLLGGFAFSVGGYAVLGMSGNSQRLLAFLALRDRVFTRDQVAGTLWTESTEGRAGASLRSAISRLDGRARHAVNVAGHDLRLADGVFVDARYSQALALRLIDSDAASYESDIGACRLGSVQ